MFPGSKSSIPRISYPKAIDIWMSVCMMFVFGALIEYAFINAMARKDKKKRTPETDEQSDRPDEVIALNIVFKPLLKVYLFSVQMFQSL